MTINKRGIEVLQDPSLNKSTAFTEAEKQALGIVELVPDVTETEDLQLSRVMMQLGHKNTDGLNAPVQYGVGIAAFVVYLLHYQLLPEDRLAELMADLFGVKLAAATIARMSWTCAERLRGFAETVRDLVACAPVKHMD